MARMGDALDADVAIDTMFGGASSAGRRVTGDRRKRKKRDAHLPTGVENPNDRES